MKLSGIVYLLFIAEDLHDGGDHGLIFLWEDLLIPLLETPHFK